MRVIRTFCGVECRDLLFAMSTRSLLLIKDKSPHFSYCGLSAPILGTAGGPAADGIPVPEIEV
jgi:hypothetical protein